MINEEWEINVDGYGLVRISSNLIRQLCRFRQLGTSSPESGGVLVGMHLNSGGVLLIDEITPPQTSDKQGRYEFYRSSEHDKLVKDVWRKSDGHSTYVGLWHSHPEPIPNFSPTDIKDWRTALVQSQYEGNRLFFAIVGQTHIRMWMGVRSSRQPQIRLIGDYEIGN